MKLLILGHGRHGKDTLAEILRDDFGMTFISSSWGAAEAILPWLNQRLQSPSFTAPRYANVNEAFDDRHNHRELWKELITEYNTPDKAKLCKHIVENSDCYVGMRCQEEYEASKHLFDLVIWVDASSRVNYNDPTMKIKFDRSMYRVDNNGSLEDLQTAAQYVVLTLDYLS